ncbi:hypothetical protein ACIPY5_03300 [Microbacterium sp. NPDC089698]|uniref:hypothetical protein n=1 Tax=Microbacterium sp. NPDC089698 TaxID=3364200 RepID=UPI003812FA02
MSEPLRRVSRLVLFSTADPWYPMRTARRAQLLAMLPVDPTEAVSAPDPDSRPHRSGAYWEYLQADDRPLFLRAHDLEDENDARRDARATFESAGMLRPVFVRDPRSDALAWWLVRDRRVVLVPSRVWLPTQRLALARHLRGARRALRAQPPWGGYIP